MIFLVFIEHTHYANELKSKVVSVHKIQSGVLSLQKPNVWQKHTENPHFYSENELWSGTAKVELLLQQYAHGNRGAEVWQRSMCPAGNYQHGRAPAGQFT